MAARRCCWMAIRCAPASTAISVSRRRTAARTFAGWLKSRRILRATATSPSSPRFRRRAKIAPPRADRADTSFREIYVATPREVCESRDPKGHYAKARAGALQAFTGIGNDYQPPTSSELTIDTSTRSVTEATDEIERMLAKAAFCSTNSSTSPPISERASASGYSVREKHLRPTGTYAKGLLSGPALGLKGARTRPSAGSLSVWP